MVIPKRDKSNDLWRQFVSSVASRLPEGSWGFMGFKSDKWKIMHQEKYRSNRVEEKFDPRCEQLVGWKIHSYCCPHAFSYGDRTLENLYALQSIVLDIDCHAERYCKSLRTRRIDAMAYYLVHDAFDDYGLPEPNQIVFTGRGLQVWWNHESMSARSSLNTWKSIVRCFIEIAKKVIDAHSEDDPMESLRGLSVDEQASLNPVGLFRIPGTYNSKARTYAYVIDGTKHIYSYQELVQFRNDYRTGSPIIPKKSKKRYQVPGHSCNVSSWAGSTALKIEKLRNLRDADLGGETRNNFCLALYCLYRSAGMDDDAAMEQLNIFNEGFKRPMREKELRSTLSSARRKLYQYSGKALIQLLDISEEEAAAIGLKCEMEQPKPEKKQDFKERNKEIIRLYKTGLTQAQVGEKMGLGRKVVGDVLRNAGINRSGNKAKKIISLHEKGFSANQIADKVGCTSRNVYRILQNAASKNAEGAPEAALTTSTQPDAITSMSEKTCENIAVSMEMDASISKKTIGGLSVPIEMESSEKVDVPPESQPASATKETCGPADESSVAEVSDQEEIPGSDFSSRPSEGLFPAWHNNGYLSWKGSEAARQGEGRAGSGVNPTVLQWPPPIADVAGCSAWSPSLGA